MLWYCTCWVVEGRRERGFSRLLNVRGQNLVISCQIGLWDLVSYHIQLFLCLVRGWVYKAFLIIFISEFSVNHNT